MELIRDVCRQRNIACIVNLHQVDAAIKYADRIIGMFQGEIVYDGPTAELTDTMIEKIYNTPMDQLMIAQSMIDPPVSEQFKTVQGGNARRENKGEAAHG
jgi:phosphonate transport system ATP-binding protein